MRRLLILIIVTQTFTVLAQSGSDKGDSIRMLREQGHSQQLFQLGISELRPGVNKYFENLPNGVNYDESKANPYPDLPDPLLMRDGQYVTTHKMWRKRRAEILEDFNYEVYGWVPRSVPDIVWRKVRSINMKYGEYLSTAIIYHGIISDPYRQMEDISVEMVITMPRGSGGNMPVILALDKPLPGFPRTEGKRFVYPQHLECEEYAWERGWAFARLYPADAQGDFGIKSTSGIIEMMNQGTPRNPDDWGVLRAWAWVASEALDFFETDDLFDENRVIIAGHSRLGSSALIAMAYDKRFAAGYISSSGQGGAKLHRRNYGEIVENLCGPGTYHYMAGNYIKYAGPLTANDLPVDAHSLIALCAPRPLFIGCGSDEDRWSDPRGMFMACVSASPVYVLLDAQGIESQIFPETGTSLIAGDIAFRQHHEGHHSAPNWPFVYQFLDKYF